MLACLAFVAFAIAGILKLVHGHGTLTAWLVIVGGLLASAAVAWGWAGPRYYSRTRPPAD